MYCAPMFKWLQLFRRFEQNTRAKNDLFFLVKGDFKAI